MSIFHIFLFTFPIILFTIRFTIKTIKKTPLPTNWPIIGMLPAILHNSHRFHDYVTQALSESNGSFEFKGPWFCNMNMLITCDSANIHHVFSKNFPNYPKGPEFRKIFDILGDGIFNADFELWEFHRKTTLASFTHSTFSSLLERIVWEKVERGLFPVLDHFSKNGTDLDLQDVFQRLTFDSICKLLVNFDPCSLSIDLPHIPCEKAFNDTMEAVFYRHLLPEPIWQLQKWLKISKEGKLNASRKAFDDFVYPCIDRLEENDDFALLTSFKNAHEEKNDPSTTRQFLRDTVVNLMLAGRDTTSTCLTWLFWLIANNPSAKMKILEEIETELHVKNDKNRRLFSIEESRKLTFLHGALCESLRLFPPVAMEHKAPIRPDTLPSGNYVPSDGKILFSFFSMGRMETLWGKDYLEFKPERWISSRGGNIHVRSYKFPAFNAGPRTCVGKDMAFVQMKMVAAAILHHYHVEMVEGHRVATCDSTILQAKYGLMVRLSKRDI